MMLRRASSSGQTTIRGNLKLMEDQRLGLPASRGSKDEPFEVPLYKAAGQRRMRAEYLVSAAQRNDCATEA